MKYKGIVDQEFMDYLNKKVSEDKRDRLEAARQWSFEYPERHITKIANSGHSLYEGIDYDTIHDYFGKCDFKYHNKKNTLYLTQYVYDNITKGNIDTFITWRWLGRDPGQPLQLGESVRYELIMYIDAKTVYNGAIYNEENEKYEYIYSV